MLIFFAPVDRPAELQPKAPRLMFIVVFFVGIGTVARLLVWGNQQ